MLMILPSRSRLKISRVALLPTIEVRDASTAAADCRSWGRLTLVSVVGAAIAKPDVPLAILDVPVSLVVFVHVVPVGIFRVVMFVSLGCWLCESADFSVWGPGEAARICRVPPRPDSQD